MVPASAPRLLLRGGMRYSGLAERLKPDRPPNPAITAPRKAPALTTDRIGTRSFGLTGLLLAAVTGLAGLGTVGCDQGVAAAYADRNQLESAADLVMQAQRGFGEHEGADAESYRGGKLAEAQTLLEGLSNSADSAARSGALRLLADLQVSKARSQTRAADIAYADISAAGANLSHQLAAIDSINQVILGHAGDGSSIEQALTEGAATIEQSRNAVTQRLAELGARREAQIEAASAAHERSAAALDQARQADEAGFAAEDIDTKEKALRAAYAAQIAGEAARLEAQTAEIAAERIAAEQAPLRSEGELWGRMAERLAALQQEHTQETTARRETHNSGEKNRTIELGGLGETWGALREQYHTSVVGPLDAAVAGAQEALKQYDQARGLIDGRSGKRSVAFSRFTAELELVNALTQRAGTAAGFVALGETIAASPALSGADAAAYTADKDTLAAQAAEAATQARALIAQGKEYAGELANDPQLGAASASLVQALDSYAARLPG